MDALVDEAWRLYDETQDACVVRPSIPILYFGDSQSYRASPLKVVTVALNPSHHEFPAHDRFARFHAAEGIRSDKLDATCRTAYLSALDNYFLDDPYRSWFGWFDEVLRGMGVSYYDGEENTALHTDFCSPLATNPTWSSLDEQQERLMADGKALWHQLVEHLSPDVIAVSVARRYRDQITFADIGLWEPLTTIARQDPTMAPYRALVQRAVLPGGKETVLVFGRAAQQPFATLTKEARRSIGRAAREIVRGR